MVGVPHSTGCETCRRRKKKCDNRAPACTACVTSGRLCPGYEKRYKFVNENATLQAHYRKKKYLLEEIGVSVGENAVSYTSPGPHAIGFRGWIPWPLISAQEHDGTNLVYILDDPGSQGVFPLTSHGNFYRYIPSRLGGNIALDSAVSCLCTVYTDLSAGWGGISERAWRTYARSLGALRLCLGDPERCFQSETICASIVLQLCELLTNADNGRWNQLSHGTKALIQRCDVARFRQPFERAMLESQRAFFIIQDLNQRRPCFLADSPWREFLQQTKETASGSSSRAFALRSKLCDWLVDIPVLLREMSGVLQSGDHEMQLASLVQRSTVIHDQIEGWYLKEVVPITVFGHRQEDFNAPFYTPVEYSQLLLAVLDCVVNSTLSVLEDAISTCTPPPLQLGCNRSKAYYASMIAGRQQTAMNALGYVRGYSAVAAKPLEFGLKQLRSLKTDQ
ncbi:hypothetical protein ETB97_007859 [Aspergillus alliaceus]|uniref:Zn(2)-C6 fungal-type domain-containing protein n=1 Tax=Petromyces alliaceus TaxID=209559 RepID=A0A8H5ZVS3_PETAA|nr:hypothetical protein ETB97_007859 [Aspergillus burnettii]